VGVVRESLRAGAFQLKRMRPYEDEDWVDEDHSDNDDFDCDAGPGEPDGDEPKEATLERFKAKWAVTWPHPKDPEEFEHRYRPRPGSDGASAEERPLASLVLKATETVRELRATIRARGAGAGGHSLANVLHRLKSIGEPSTLTTLNPKPQTLSPKPS